MRETPSQDLTLRWEGKLTKDCFGNKHEALSVVVSGISTYKEGKLLGVQRLEKASGTPQADASYDLLEIWNLKQHVKALIFDTTASNTSWNNSAAKSLENVFSKRVVIIYTSLLLVMYIHVYLVSHQLQMMPISYIFEKTGKNRPLQRLSPF